MMSEQLPVTQCTQQCQEEDTTASYHWDPGNCPQYLTGENLGLSTNLSHVLSLLKRLRFYFDNFDTFEENPNKFLLQGSLKIKKNSQIFINPINSLF